MLRLLLATSLLLALAPVAAAATRTVTSSADAGAGSLRDTVAAAGDGDTIIFDGVTVITLATNITFAVSLTIEGGGVVLDGGDTTDLLVFTGATLVVRDVTFRDGAGGYGAGFANQGTGQVELVRTRFVGNSAFNAGGLSNYGQMQIRDSLFEGNSTTGNSGAGLINGGALRIINTTFSGNVVTGVDRVGGAIAQSGSTVALGGGGGPPPTLELSHCTITGNVATGEGGGVWISGGTATIANSIIVGNTAPAGTDLFGAVTSEGYNVIGSTAGATITVGATDQVGVNPSLGALADNGGGLSTHAITATSVAFDAGSCDLPGGATLTADQRALPRPSAASCDVGAFELQILELTIESDEPAGANCEAGGDRTDRGYDLDDDGLLDAAEIVETTYECVPVSDAAPSSDAGDPGVDRDGGGCCQAPGRPPTGGLLLAAIVLLGLRRRRRA